MFIRTIAACSVAFLLAACTSSNQAQDNSENFQSNGGFTFESGTGFLPVEPRQAKIDVEIEVNGNLVSKDIRALTKTELLEKLLLDSRSSISISKINEDGSLGFIYGSVTGKRGKYLAVMDFSNYVIDDYKDRNGSIVGEARYGIGLRLSARIETKKRGINIGSILKLGVAASKDELNGALLVEAIGLTSQEIQNLLPGIMPSIDETSIQSALESMAAVKAKIGESETKIGARVLAVKMTEPVTPALLDVQPVSAF